MASALKFFKQTTPYNLHRSQVCSRSPPSPPPTLSGLISRNSSLSPSIAGAIESRHGEDTAADAGGRRGEPSRKCIGVGKERKGGNTGEKSSLVWENVLILSIDVSILIFRASGGAATGPLLASGLVAASPSLGLVERIAEILKLTSACSEFVESAEEILEKRRTNQTLLESHSTLLDLLEIPQLMDILPVIQALATGVQQTTLSLHSQLLQKLGSKFELVLDTHHWVPLPAVGFPSNTFCEESQEDIIPPPNLVEHPPLAIFINGVSAAMNELHYSASLSLKPILAQELVKGLQGVSDSLLRYNTDAQG
ncbi:hypothetical protein ACH5RR_041398 [Cinchona calisaya]|uniref:Conserved oligomeric Golgi complex subunit 8 n=1 Tax=Cinchona calisaya TaxID=153742 RepID=A0ABD2XTK3_9GENT